MLHGELAENVIATIATVLWSTQMIPQGLPFPSFCSLSGERHLKCHTCQSEMHQQWNIYSMEGVQGKIRRGRFAVHDARLGYRRSFLF